MRCLTTKFMLKFKYATNMMNDIEKATQDE